MLLVSFVEGISLAYKAFEMHKIKVQISNLEDQIYESERRERDVSTELQGVRETITKVSNFQMNFVRAEAMRMLGKHEKATASNADAMAIFIASMGAQIMALTFNGEISRSTPFGSRYKRGFISGTMDHINILETLSEIAELKSVAGGRIVTNAVTSCSEMKATAVAIASFFKILQLFKLHPGPLTDGEKEEELDLEFAVRFGGQFSLHKYIEMINDQKPGIQLIPPEHRNVYVLGRNGSGKSSWANLIAKGTIFEEGKSLHTTMIPQGYDVEVSERVFRIWDTPGLFDGSAAQGNMEDCMNHIIELNGYFSGVVFVFSGSVPADESTDKVLKYAVDHLGPKVRQSFIVIINSFYRTNSEGWIGSYADKLSSHGFEVSKENFFVSSAKKDANESPHFIRNILARFTPQLVLTLQKAYETLLQEHGDVRFIVKHLHDYSRDELSRMIRHGKVEIRVSRDINATTKEKPCLIIFRHYSRGYILRKLGRANCDVKEQRIVRIVGNPDFVSSIRDALKYSYVFQKKNHFLKDILPNPNTVLVHTPDGNYDYDLRDLSNMAITELRNEIHGQLFLKAQGRASSSFGDP